MANKIYESPDGGRTVYERYCGQEPSERKLITYEGKPPKVTGNSYDPIWGEVTGFPDWMLIAKYPELREAYEHFLQVQDEYKVLSDLINSK
jgi:hypothetical protein